MPSGVDQLFLHVTLWSRFPTGLTAVNPMDAASLTANNRDAVASLNRYVGEMRLQEIGLLKALAIDPDALRTHLEKEKPFSEFFLGIEGIEAPSSWMAVHPSPPLTVDDLQQFRHAITGAKRRLNHWGRHPTQGRPAGLSEHLLWLQEFAHARAALARLALQLGEPEAGIQMFYDPKARQRGRVSGIEESLAVYFQVQRTVRVPR